jgi:hypothetical protein
VDRELIPAFIAAVSSWIPSPTAPNEVTLRIGLPGKPLPDVKGYVANRVDAE